MSGGVLPFCICLCFPQSTQTELPEPEYGQFLAGDCYIVQYKYGAEDHPQYTLYFWQGRDSSTMEKGQSAARTVELANKLGNGVCQCRVVQGKEPAHFSALFKVRGTDGLGGGGRVHLVP